MPQGGSRRLNAPAHSRLSPPPPSLYPVAGSLWAQVSRKLGAGGWENREDVGMLSPDRSYQLTGAQSRERRGARGLLGWAHRGPRS